jgi:hypothetical protein
MREHQGIAFDVLPAGREVRHMREHQGIAFDVLPAGAGSRPGHSRRRRFAARAFPTATIATQTLTAGGDRAAE